MSASKKNLPERDPNVVIAPLVYGNFQLGGFGLASFNLATDQTSAVNNFMAQLEIIAAHGAWDLYVTPRIRVSPVTGGNTQISAFLHQAFVSFSYSAEKLKLGKIYRVFGRMWDYGLYGPLIGDNDMKFQTDIGASAEGHCNISDGWYIDHTLQYYPVDGHTFALTHPGFFSKNNIRHSNIIAARLAPGYTYDDVNNHIQTGFSVQHHTAKKNNNASVISFAVDTDITANPWAFFTEIGIQRGIDTAGKSNKLIPENQYIWLGVQLKTGYLRSYYNMNIVQYISAPDYYNILHQPGVEFKVNNNLSFLAEYAISTTTQATLPTLQESGLYLIVMGKI